MKKDIITIDKMICVLMIAQKRKALVREHQGFSIPLWVGGLCPRLATMLFISIQPFANVVSNYTSHNRDNK